MIMFLRKKNTTTIPDSRNQDFTKLIFAHIYLKMLNNEMEINDSGMKRSIVIFSFLF